jgi:ribose transport system substrate-binding protein
VPGVISIVDAPVNNGKALGSLAIKACAGVPAPCQVAYMEGFRSLPLDNARTDAVKSVIEGQTGISLVATVEGGYTQDQGRSAFQDIIQANPDVNVVIGSSQAVSGAYLAAGPDSGIKFIGNGASQSNVDAVLNGDWFAIYVLDNVANGKKAAELGLGHARGETVEMVVLESDLSPNGGIGTLAALKESKFVSGYND